MAFVPTFLRASSFTPRSLAALSRRHAVSPSGPRRTAHQRQIVTAALPSNPRIGFIGLGVMGLPMAANLSKVFPDLVVWNRSDKTAALQSAVSSAGSSATIEAVSTPAGVVAAADITFSMLSTPEAVRAVFYDHDDPALAAAAPGKCIVDCSTLQIPDMVATHSAAVEKGALFLEAPVSGSKVPAEQGQLIFLCAGDRPVFDDPVTQKAFEVMGKRSFFLGDVGNGTKMKLVVNQLMATMLAALGESIVLTEAVGLPVPDLLEVLSLGAMNNPMFALKGPKMQHGEKGYATNFPLEHAQKDVRFAQALGDEQGVPLSVASAANEWYKAAKGMGLSREDFCAVIESMRASAGKS